VFVGRVGPSKGVDVLVRAAIEAAPLLPGLRLVIVGRDAGGFAAELVQAAQAAGHPDLLDFRGHVDHEALPGLLRDADVFAAPSPCEGGPGFVYLEAMAAGLPVIACAGTGAADVVEDGETGYLVAPGDVGAVRDALLALCGDPDRRGRMGRRAREYALRHADGGACVARIAALYRAAHERVVTGDT
jgi:glycosyltransferase involved in cell wall biosynthesis